MKIKIIALLCITAQLLSWSCKKEFLEKKADKATVIPTTIPELQAILDYDTYLNQGLTQLCEISADNYDMPDDQFLSLTVPFQRNAYIWNRDIYENDRVNKSNDWTYAYRIALYANIALEGINKIKPESSSLPAWNNVKGSALFFRAFAFYLVAQEFAPAYDKNTANIDLGIPLRLVPGIDEISVRSTVAQTYQQIIADLKEALQYLPDLPVVTERPSKSAATALLARTYLLMGDYEQSLVYANVSLGIQNSLMDYNTLPLTSARPFPGYKLNPEVIFYAKIEPGFVTLTTKRMVNDDFFLSYASNDLRSVGFFTKRTGTYAGRYNFKGSYDGSAQIFMGLATDEVYLTRAECYARLGNTASALTDLNVLLKNRYDKNSFVPLTAATDEQALYLILDHRKKELFFRGIRWSDLKRLNKDQRFAITLTRTVNGITYTLPPNDKRYVLPIPEEIIELSGIQQNER